MKVNYTSQDGKTTPIKGHIQRYGTDGKAAEKIEFDAVVTSTHTHQAHVTAHPVEQGVKVSDFFRPEPVALKIEGVISNHPIELPGSQAAGVREEKKRFEWKGDSKLNLGPLGSVTLNGPGVIGMTGGAIGKAVGLNKYHSTAIGFSDEMFRAEMAYEIIADIVDKGESVSIITSLAQYDDMVIESFTPTRNANTGNSLQFSIDCKQIRIVNTKTASVPKTNIVQSKKAVKKGKQATEDIATESDRVSVARAGLGGIGLL